MEQIKIAIADDHAIMRQGLKNILELENDLKVIALEESGKGALKALKEKKPDVLILDINMPKMNGVELLKKIKKLGLKAKLIVLTIHDEKAYLVETMALGAKGYVLKDADSELLIDAIRQVVAGGTYVYPSLRKYLDKRTVKTIDQGKGDIQALLTNRENEILQHIAQGMNNKEIAEQLSISEKTVKNHVTNVFKKIGVNDRTSAALYTINKANK